LEPRLISSPTESSIEFENGESLKIDFFSEPYRYFQRKHRGKSELLARAIGTAKGMDDVWDATLGLAEDCVFLSLLGCTVRASERHPMLYQLLEQAFANARIQPETKVAAEKIKIFLGDSAQLLKNLSESQRPQVIYLDPMFPEKKKSALPRKEMRLFRLLVGEDPDADKLFQVALETAKTRVVVKRPLKAPDLAKGVIHRFEGQTVRYDLYKPINFKES
jgi:16S rRNA (guanine1516-N2)-methyltransferase